MRQPPMIVSLGEVLWDVFPDGARFGGAPANVACHAAALGADARMVSRVGDDRLGRDALAALRGHGVDVSHVALDAEHPTGTVQVELDAAGKPTFTIGAEAAWDHLAWTGQFDRLAADCDAVCFGTLGQRGRESRATIQRFAKATSAETLRILDINLRAPFFDDDVIRQSFELANVVKLNDEELPQAAAVANLAGSEEDVLKQLSQRFELRLIALTRGERGAVLVRGDDVCELPAAPAEVVDTVGAGDAYTAMLILGLLQGMDLATINRRASRIAAYVCSQPGATPELPESLLEA